MSEAKMWERCLEFTDYMLAKNYMLAKKNAIDKDFIEEIAVRWEKLYKAQLKKWGFSNKSIRRLFEWGKYGHNWEKLWATEDEENRTLPHLIEDFAYEIWYCSDRMGIDRLFRCHWQFNMIMIKAKKEGLND